MLSDLLTWSPSEANESKPFNNKWALLSTFEQSFVYSDELSCSWNGNRKHSYKPWINGDVSLDIECKAYFFMYCVCATIQYITSTC